MNYVLTVLRIKDLVIPIVRDQDGFKDGFVDSCIEAFSPMGEGKDLGNKRFHVQFSFFEELQCQRPGTGGSGVCGDIRNFLLKQRVHSEGFDAGIHGDLEMGSHGADHFQTAVQRRDHTCGVTGDVCAAGTMETNSLRKFFVSGSDDVGAQFFGQNLPLNENLAVVAAESVDAFDIE